MNWKLIVIAGIVAIFFWLLSAQYWAEIHPTTIYLDPIIVTPLDQ